MLKINKILLMLTVVSIGFTSCKKDDKDPVVTPTNSNLSLSINGLQDLGDDYKYEGWILVDGAPKTTGTFTVDENGAMSTTSFSINAADLAAATKFILTIEPSPDPSTAPSDVHILAGDFSSNTSTLTIGDPAAIGDDFSTSAGVYILGSPTNDDDNDEKSGVWWLDASSGSPEAGLDLPTLPAGWNYEGWVVIDGTPVSTGTFTNVNGADNDDSFSGTGTAPEFPGEDFLMNAPTGLSFPTDLSGAVTVISVEPVPDNSSTPFLLKPLVGPIAPDAMEHENYPMNNNSITNPTGTATR